MKTTPEAILQVICNYYSVTAEELKSRTKERPYAAARHMFFYMCRLYTHSSYDKIGELVNRNHATVIYAFSKFSGYMTPEEESEVNFLSRIINNHTQGTSEFTDMFCNLGRYFAITKSIDFYNEFKNIENYKPVLITAAEVAKMCMVSRATVHRWFREGRITNQGTATYHKYNRDEIIRVRDNFFLNRKQKA